MFNGTSFIAMRSIISKLVPEDELGKKIRSRYFYVLGFINIWLFTIIGKINSLFGICESIMPLVYGPMYSIIYRQTINIFPGTFYLLGAVLTLPAVFIFLLVLNFI